MDRPDVLAGGFALAAVLLLAGCGQTADPTLSGPRGPIVCDDVITQDVAVRLDWNDGALVRDVEVSDGRCHYEFPALGVVTVGSTGSGDDARAAYDAACGRLDVDDELTRAVVGAGTGCAQGLDPATETGTAEVDLLTLDGVALQVRIEARAPLDRPHVLAGLRELVRTATQAW